jgi:tetratricopeptide (TPR) repeat protein/predicted Ser/Thr protein kinase
MDAAALKASIAGELFGDLAVPMKIGRYEVEAPLGEGGMSVVYAARDPVLERRVALKLLSSAAPTDERRRARMVREAQALARLSHPNVVQVYEVGVHDDDMFVAMELVEGVSLRDWLSSSPKVGEIENVFVQAGRGLAAAHEANLVHRDFKPTNVMVGKDGRVRVLDFGLAFGPGLSTETSGQISHSSSGDRLTRTGAVMGTPAYMAPEQIRGEPADDRADQFSFCVALFEALVGSRPYKFNDLRKRPESAVIASWDGVPHSWRAPLRRGLAIAAENRWATMEGLLAALGRRRAWATRAPWLFVGGAVVLAIAARSEAQPSPCGDVLQSLPTWDDERADQIEAAFSSTHEPYAGDVWADSRRRIDAFADDWASTRAKVCASEPPPGALACLDRAQGIFEAVVNEYSTVDRGSVRQAHQLASLLESPTACEGPEAQAFDARMEPSALQRVNEARAAHAAGRSDAALEILDRVAAQRELDGTDALADLLRLRGAARYQVADSEGALRDLARAIDTANSSVARADALVAWIRVLLREGRTGSASDAARILEIAIGTDGPASLRADLIEIRGLLRVRGGKTGDGVSTLEEALRLRDELDDTQGAARTRMNIANALDGSDRAEDRTRAESLYRDEAERRKRELGPNHPGYARALFNLSRPIARRGDWEEVERLLRQADQIEALTLTENSPSRAKTRLELGEALINLDRLDDAETVLDAAWTILQRLPESDLDHRAARALLANFTMSRRQFRATLEHHLALAKSNPDNVMIWQNIAIAYVKTNQPAKAREAVSRAQALLPLQTHFPDVMVKLLTLDFRLVEVECLRLEGKPEEANAAAQSVEAALTSMGELEPGMEGQRQRLLGNVDNLLDPP